MKFYSVLLLFLCSPSLAGQAMRVEYFTVNDGLSTREITDLHIGDDGYLWVGTLDGLNRFDGHSFLTFGYNDPADGPGLSRGGIETINADIEGNLVLTFVDFSGYFDRFNPRSFRSEQVALVPSNGVNGYPRAIETDTVGRTFVVTVWKDTTNLYEYTREGFKRIFQAADEGWMTIAPRIDLLPLSNGQFLLYDEQHGFRRLSANGEYLGSFNSIARKGRHLYKMIEGPDNYVYLSFRGGYPLYRWRVGSGSDPSPVPNPDDGLRYTQIFKDKLGQLLLLGTEDFLGKQYPDEYYLIDTSGTLKLFDRELPTDRLVSEVAAVNFNETCYLALREGLGVIERNVKPIATYLTEADITGDGSSVKGIAEDTAGTVYVATQDGSFYRMPRAATEPEKMVLRDIDSTRVTIRRPEQLMFDPIRNAVWAVGHPGGRNRGGLLLRYNVATGTTEAYRSSYALNCLTMSPQGDIYVGAAIPDQMGILSFNAETGSFAGLFDAPLNRRFGRSVLVNYLYYSRTGTLLIGTERLGLLSFDPRTRVVEMHSRTDPMGDSPVELNALKVKVIYEDVADNWWIGTEAGLWQINPADSTTVSYTRQDGLSNNYVVGIVPDSTGGFWLSTKNGLVHLPAEIRKGTLRRYYTEDGLASDAFNRYAFHRDHTGRYYFGGESGLSVFRDSDLSAERAGSDVMLTQVVIYGRNNSRPYTRNLDTMTHIEVYANEKSIAISFALPVGQRPSRTQLRVKLEGFNEEWRELRNERTVRYNNLPSGNYRLLVQAAGANGNYGQQMRTLNIRVRQYLIERTWFQFLIATVIVGLFFLILQAKLRERLRNEQLRTQLSSDIHDEVSGLLAGITLQAELLQHRTDDEKLRTRLQTVGEAGRNAMSKMSDVIWSIDSRRDNIGNLLQRMQEHADEVLLPLDIRYDFSAKGFINERELAGNVRQDLYFIYKEAINNVARHSNATYVEIELEQYAQTFEMFIRDNGKGKESDEYPVYSSTRFTPKKGQGKDNMRMRAQRLRAELTIDDRSGYTLTLRMRRIA